MQYLLLFLLAWLVVCLPALIYAAVIEGRRRRDAEALDKKIAALQHDFELLERRLRSLAATPIATHAATSTPPPDVQTVPPIHPTAASHTAPPAYAPLMAPKPTPAAGVERPIAPPTVQPKIAETGGMGLTSRVLPPEAKPTTHTPPPPPPPPSVAKPPAMPATQPGAHAGVTLPSPASRPPAAQRSALGGTTAPSHTPKPLQRSRSLEEMIGTNWLPKLGVVIIVIGMGLLTAREWFYVTSWWQIIGALGRSAVVLLGGLGMLFAGIAFEKKDRYKILGRAMIGGGWAVTFLLAYAIRHAPTFIVLSRDSIDLGILLAVAGAMVWHTLNYNSQTVTGLAFLLGFAAVTLNPDPPFNLIAGALLICGMTVIVLRRQWYELEVFGILASYGNHFYWLYSAFQKQGAFPHHSASVALAISYWVIFRASYLLHKVSRPQQESVSTAAALLNPLLFLGVMKYQSFHPEWAFAALLTMGAVEFVLGQLPVSRRRRAPFLVLSSLGAALMVAAVPFKYSSNSMELLWLAGAEVFLLAGILTRERLFRGFGLILSFLIALYGLPVHVATLAEQVFNNQPHHDAPLSLVLAVVAVVLYANAHVTRRLWPKLFEENPESPALTVLSYAASLFTVAAVYAYAPENAVAVVLAFLVLILSWTGRQASIPELIYQGHWIAAVAIVQVTVTGSDLATTWHNVPQRMLTFAPVAALLYLSSRFVRLSKTANKDLFSAGYAWSATTLLALLIWFQGPNWAIAVLWVVLALALSLVGHGLERSDLKWQALVLTLLSFARSIQYNFDLEQLFHGITFRLLTISATALGIYLLARWAPRKGLRPVYSVAGTILLSLLALKETHAPWTAVAWISLAFVLGLAGRWWKDRALLWQTHLLAALAVGWTLFINFAPQYRGSRVQLISVGVSAILLYVLTWVTNVAGVVEDYRMPWAYPWAGSLLLSWLAWYQLEAVNISLAWGTFGLLLYELPELLKSLKIDVSRSAANWHGQAYVALLSSFAHLFYANFNSPVSGSFLQVVTDPRIVTVIPLVFVYFYVYSRVHKQSAISTPPNPRVTAKAVSA